MAEEDHVPFDPAEAQRMRERPQEIRAEQELLRQRFEHDAAATLMLITAVVLGSVLGLAWWIGR